MKILLSNRGLRDIKLADDGQRALEIVAADVNYFHIIFMDNMMTTMARYTLLPRYFHIVILIEIFLCFIFSIEWHRSSFQASSNRISEYDYWAHWMRHG